MIKWDKATKTKEIKKQLFLKEQSNILVNTLQFHLANIANTFECTLITTVYDFNNTCFILCYHLFHEICDFHEAAQNHEDKYIFYLHNISFVFSLGESSHIMLLFFSPFLNYYYLLLFVLIICCSSLFFLLMLFMFFALHCGTNKGIS